MQAHQAQIQSSSEETDAFPALASSTRKCRRAQSNRVILLAEDDEDVRCLTSRLLQQMGFSVLEAGDGQEAVAIAEREGVAHIDLLVTDILMPQMGGKELAAWITAARPATRVLFISAYPDGGLAQKGMSFLQKPFGVSALQSKVRELLGD